MTAGNVVRVHVRYEDQDLDLPRGSVVAIGTFDGVHVGHRAVLAEALSIAHELGAASVAAIPDRHPATVVRPETAPRLHSAIAELCRETSIGGPLKKVSSSSVLPGEK